MVSVGGNKNILNADKGLPRVKTVFGSPAQAYFKFHIVLAQPAQTFS